MRMYIHICRCQHSAGLCVHINSTIFFLFYFIIFFCFVLTRDVSPSHRRARAFHFCTFYYNKYDVCFVYITRDTIFIKKSLAENKRTAKRDLSYCWRTSHALAITRTRMRYMNNFGNLACDPTLYDSRQ